MRSPNALCFIGPILVGRCTGFVFVPRISPQDDANSWLHRPECRSSVLHQGFSPLRLPSSIATSSSSSQNSMRSDSSGEPNETIAQERELFDWLAQGAGVLKMVSLVSPNGYRGLVTDCDVHKGQYRVELHSRAIPPPLLDDAQLNLTTCFQSLLIPRNHPGALLPTALPPFLMRESRRTAFSVAYVLPGQRLVSHRYMVWMIILEVPSECCLWSTRYGEVTGLHGQTNLCWEVAGDLREPVSDEDYARGLTWDVRLALALMEATADAQVGGEMWHRYGGLLPTPHTVTVPFCLPERLLVQLHNSGMASRARKQLDRLRSLFPDMMRTLLSHPKTAVYARASRGENEQAVPPTESDVAPTALAWAFAMVRSRAFAAGDDRFAFVPFLDMANHDFSPTANFTFEEPGVFRLRALRNLEAGEEATISYGQQLDAEQLMVQYGFPAPSTASVGRVLLDARPFRDDGAGQRGGAGGTGGSTDARSGQGQAEEWGSEQRQTLMDELFFRAQQRFVREAEGDDAAFKAKVGRVIPVIPPIAAKVEQMRGKGGATEGARALLEEIREYQSENFPTSAEQDQELLGFCLGEGRRKVDPRLAYVVRYRIGRKETHSVAEAVLEAFLTAPPPGP